MLINTIATPKDTSISAMKARQSFGEILNKGFYQGKSFLVERAGTVMVAIIPVSDYREVQRIKQEARERFFAMTDDVRARVAQSGVTDEELQAEIDQAINEVRSK